jgi:hypothetical protein
MKKKVLILGLLCIMGIAVLSVSNAYATLFTCTVVSTGCDTAGNVVVYATSPGFPTPAIGYTVFYTTNAANKNQILAAALTAVANSGHLVMDLSGTTDYSIVMAAMAAP